MQLTPRYGTDPIITLDGPPSAIAEPAIRQRRRLLDLVSSFDAEHWAAPTRCAGWSARDVIVHLDSTNSFWSYSVGQGLKGKPTEFLATFDPVASPLQLVAAAGPISDAEVLDRFAASTVALVDLWESLDDAGWDAIAESPPGHVSVSALTYHAVWDSWIHELDIVLPAGGAPTIEADEVAACLRYGCALSPGFAINHGPPRLGVLSVVATGPDLSVRVEIGDRVRVVDGADGADVVDGADGADSADLRLSGPAVDLLEAFSARRTFDGLGGESVAPDAAWMLTGLTTAFDQEP